MPDIQQLPPSVINKIAAGEVIERPASVVKELMENSVDAGATRIDVSVEKGGTDLIRIADNGCGIQSDQLLLAIASHATSKIHSADDLFDVRSLGFRGEALASIAEVSQFRLRSRTSADAAGAELEVRAGQIGEVEPCGAPIGTTIEVRQLFCNTPVRRKFLRTTQTEMGHVTEAFTRIALVNTAVHFTLRHNDRIIHDLPPVENWRERIATFFGNEIGDALIPVDSDDGMNHLSGFVAEPSFSRANNRMQYVFLNGRHIRDRGLQHALGEAYRGLLLTGRYPIAFLRFQIPANSVDVNVHPTKLEVRFQDGGRLYSQLLGSLRQRFLRTDLRPKVQSDSLSTDATPQAAVDQQHTGRHRDELMQWAKGQLEPRDPGSLAGPAPTGASDAPHRTPPPAVRTQSELPMDYRAALGGVPDFKPFPGHRVPSGAPSPHASSRPESAASDEMDPPPPSHAATDSTHSSPTVCHLGMQIHNRYLIVENEAGVEIIDQHALHERILFEQLREKVLSGHMEKQRLLVPEPVSLTPAEAAVATDAKDEFARLGIDLEPFGGDTVLVSSYPAMLGHFDASEVVRQLVERMGSSGQSPDRRDVLEDCLHMISCKAAVKAGDPLTKEEITSLLEQRPLYQDTHHCPHGRPTSLVFTKEELDRRFRRI